MNITIPERVWNDYLSPDVSTMQAELGLPVPTYRKVGRGGRYLYVGVPEHKARELAEYLFDRADGMLMQGIVDPYDRFEKAQRDTDRAAMKVAETIREELR